jgi:hypothetical protein
MTSSWCGQPTIPAVSPAREKNDMTKMTPEQEAAYALDWDLPRADLSEAVQLAYGRLRQQRQAATATAPPQEAEVQPPPKTIAAFRRSAGTATPIDVIRRAFRPPSNAALAADILAIDRGEGRTLACLFRGFYGEYPRRFGRKMLDLAPDALVIRPFWSSPFRSKFRIPREDITSAHLRPPRLGESGKVLDDGIYPAGAVFEWAAFVVVICESAGGRLELGVPRPDVALVLHYLNPHAPAPADGSN